MTQVAEKRLKEDYSEKIYIQKGKMGGRCQYDVDGRQKIYTGRGKKIYMLFTFH